MRRPAWIRKAPWFALAFICVASHTPEARAQEPELGARLGCDPAVSAGRVRCTLEVTAPAGTRLSWVDALVSETPEFARPLRSRVAYRGKREDQRASLVLAWIASAADQGKLVVRARAVVCPLSGNAACRALSRETAFVLRVGR